MFGITRATSPAHIARAALEAIALQVKDAIDAMAEASGLQIKHLKVDGGASVNDLLMQIQADLIESDVVRPQITETTALGAALLAGLAVKFWKDHDDIKQRWSVDRTFSPDHMQGKDEILAYWAKALERTRNWVEN
jgi:glycerol kinase